MLDPELEDIARRAERLYEEKLKGELEKNHWGQLVVIEPTSGDYYLGRKLDEASAKAHTAHPDRLFFALRIGYPVAVEIGACPQERDAEQLGKKLADRICI